MRSGRILPTAVSGARAPRREAGAKAARPAMPAAAHVWLSLFLAFAGGVASPQQARATLPEQPGATLPEQPGAMLPEQPGASSPQRAGGLVPVPADGNGDHGVAGKARPWWVFFVDHGGAVLDAASMLCVAEDTAPEAWARRGAMSPVPDLLDLEPCAEYVAGVAAHGRIRHRSRWLNAVSCELTAAAVEEVRGLPFVGRLAPVAVSRAQSLGPAFSPSGRPLGRTVDAGARPRGPDPYGPAFGQLEEINVVRLHQAGYTGNRVGVMMLDTGFRKDHHAFANAHLAGEWDYVFEDGDTQNESGDDYYQHYHGTGTWATLGGYDPGHIVGPAFDATFYLAKTEDVRSETQAEEDNYVAALEWADRLGVSVVSASLSYTCFDDGFCYDYPWKDGDRPVISRAVDIAVARGIVCVNSAGNYGWSPNSLGTPADADSIIAVGAVDSLNRIADFSSRGPSDDGQTKPEVVARGVDTWWADAGAPDWYGPSSGTSLSCPLVGGAAALLREAHPEWDPMTLRAALMNTADRHSHPDNDYGWGRIDTWAALQSAPVTFATPFSLSLPADGDTAKVQPVRFTWRSSHDPDEGGPIEYTLSIREDMLNGRRWVYPAGNDTTLLIAPPMADGLPYLWEVTAEDQDGNRRFSRERRRIWGGPVSAAPAPARSGIPLVCHVTPNPSPGAFAFELESGAALDDRANWTVYDALGRRTASGMLNGGTGTWDGSDLSGHPAAAGVYYLEIRRGAESARRTIVRAASGQTPGPGN